MALGRSKAPGEDPGESERVDGSPSSSPAPTVSLLHLELWEEGGGAGKEGHVMAPPVRTLCS